ncbi:hypothetical protein BKA70DRAFT_1121444 [Coprinopsis sp. MPI-PUGE-AT-0042]|nr:hypothetical protein BKA70DRAFT_1121444 [Coprinopsis sp. MPI-PUGE-AT-0042]
MHDQKVTDGIDTSLLGHAFDGPPNHYSAFALQLFLGHKCFAENLSKSTAEGIHGAFKLFWNELYDGGRYNAPYFLDEDSGVVKGNPAQAPCVSNVLKAIKTRVGRKGEAAYQDHAEAMSIEDMDQFMGWSLSQCPAEWLLNPPNNVVLLKLNVEHGFIRGYGTGAFSLFGQNNEMLNLRAGDVRLDCVSPDGKEHMFVVLSERKGWQKKACADSDSSQGYKLNDRPDEPSINAHRHIGPWIRFVELRIGRKLKPTKYVFPYIAPNGVIHPDRPCSYTFVSDLLSCFTKSASIKHAYTTHCFCCGGAQYRLQYAPEEKRWDLSTVQWWGGWAVGEDGNSYQGALHPDRIRKTDRTKHVEGCAATKEDLLDFKASVSRNLATDLSEFRAWLPQMLKSFAVSAMSPGGSIATSTANIPLLPSPPLPPPQSSCALSNSPEPECPPSRKASTCLPRPRGHSRPSEQAPIPGLVIPNLPRGERAWKVAVQQWEEGGGSLATPLKDWPKAWYTGSMKNTFSAKRSQCRLVFDAYESCNHDDATFLARYPGAAKGIRALPPDERRVSKNGSPEERDS